GGVEVPVALLDVLAVVALAAGEPKETLLEDRIASVPQCQRQAEPLRGVGDAGDPVLAPAVGARAGVVVGEGVPGAAVGAVVLADGAPGALAEVGAPAQPGPRVVGQAAALGVGVGHGGDDASAVPARRPRVGATAPSRASSRI